MKGLSRKVNTILKRLGVYVSVCVCKCVCAHVCINLFKIKPFPSCFLHFGIETCLDCFQIVPVDGSGAFVDLPSLKKKLGQISTSANTKRREFCNPKWQQSSSAGCARRTTSTHNSLWALPYSPFGLITSYRLGFLQLSEPPPDVGNVNFFQ